MTNPIIFALSIVALVCAVCVELVRLEREVDHLTARAASAERQRDAALEAGESLADSGARCIEILRGYVLEPACACWIPPSHGDDLPPASREGADTYTHEGGESASPSWGPSVEVEP